MPDLTPVDVGGTVSQQFSFESNPAQPGRLRVVAYSVSSLGSNGTLLNLRFNVIGPPRSKTDLVMQNLLLNEVDLSTTAQAGKLTVKK